PSAVKCLCFWQQDACAFSVQYQNLPGNPFIHSIHWRTGLERCEPCQNPFKQGNRKPVYPETYSEKASCPRKTGGGGGI
ncbi:hypothetical protein KAX14_04265, partial [Candidatus Bipolaricaulota bacterium]|nr:hypothetical protein [Candidatus Bipolaricaulota bacterium]